MKTKIAKWVIEANGPKECIASAYDELGEPVAVKRGAVADFVYGHGETPEEAMIEAMLLSGYCEYDEAFDIAITDKYEDKR